MADGDEHLGRTMPLIQPNAQNWAAAANQQGQADAQNAASMMGTPSPQMIANNAYQAGLSQPNGQGPGYVARQAAGAPRTIVSGVDRLKAAAHGAEALVGEFEGFVAGMFGEDGQKQATTPDLPPGAGTVSVVHDAADAVESVFARMADLVKRAKAAHG